MNTINYSRGSEGGSLTICGDPWPDSNVGNGDPVTYEVPVWILGKLGVHGTIEAARLVYVSVQSIRIDFAGGS